MRRHVVKIRAKPAADNHHRPVPQAQPRRVRFPREELELTVNSSVTAQSSGRCSGSGFVAAFSDSAQAADASRVTRIWGLVSDCGMSFASARLHSGRRRSLLETTDRRKATGADRPRTTGGVTCFESECCVTGGVAGRCPRWTSAGRAPTPPVTCTRFFALPFGNTPPCAGVVSPLRGLTPRCFRRLVTAERYTRRCGADVANARTDRRRRPVGKRQLRRKLVRSAQSAVFYGRTAQNGVLPVA